MQPYHPRLPWILVGPHPEGGFVVQDTRTGEAVHALDKGAVAHFAAAHSAAPGYGGAGDAVRAVTARLGIGACTPCEARQAQLNGLLPRLWRR